ncbi:MAG: hypothetical protein IJK52_00615, partial [Oscillospiraceae bacterium]|nr:hypothetical protein [Oscillospiraceae bacterium]
TGKDDPETEANAKTALVNLEEAYSAARAALEQYEESAKSVQSAAQDYSIGTGSKTAWSDALSARADAKSAAVSALSAFSRQANDLNALTGGWVSRAYGWNEEAFGPLFEAEVLPPIADIPGASGDSASANNGASADNGASDNGASADNGASDGGASTDSGASGDGGASTDSGASDDGASADNGASDGGANTDSGASDDGASADNGASTNDGASGGGASTDSGDAGQTIDPDSDEIIYGGTLRTVGNGASDSGQTERINGPRIGEDGKVYPFDPEDEALELQKESGQQAPDPEQSVKEAGEALIAVLETLFGVSDEED